jgi:hypothetical protein
LHRRKKGFCTSEAIDTEVSRRRLRRVEEKGRNTVSGEMGAWVEVAGVVDVDGETEDDEDEDEDKEDNEDEDKADTDEGKEAVVLRA